MKILYLSFSILIFLTSYLECKNIKIENGKAKVVYATVDGIRAWSESEKDSLVNEKTKVAVGTITAYNPTVVIVTPTEWEVNLSSIITSFKGTIDFYSHNNKDILFEKIQLIKQQLDTAIDIGDTTKSNKLQGNYNWLKSYYGTLP